MLTMINKMLMKKLFLQDDENNDNIDLDYVNQAR